MFKNLRKEFQINAAKSYKFILRTIIFSKNEQIRFLISGLILFFLSLLFITNKPMYFLAYFFAGGIFYLGGILINDIILYLLILSIFFDTGIGARLFILEPAFFNMGSGWFFSAMTFFVLLYLLVTMLLINSGSTLKQKFKLPDLFIAIFAIWNGITFLIQPNINSFYGVIALFEIILVFYLIRIHMTRSKIKFINVLIISSVLFQCLISSGQFIRQKPLGLVVEPILAESVQKLSLIEGSEIFRVTGTFGHPNMLAAFLIAFAPFLLLSGVSGYLFVLLSIVLLLTVFLSYSRTSWLIIILQYFFILKKKNFSQMLKKEHYFNLVLIIFAGITILYIMFLPFFLIRFKTTPFSLTEFGSLGMRIKLTDEAVNLIVRSPILGIGLNRSLEMIIQNPITNIFDTVPIGSFYKIHNTYLEIAAESGLPGLLFYILFLLSLLFSKRSEKIKSKYWNAALLGFSGLLILFYFNPFFHTPLWRVMLLLAAIMIA